MGQEVSSSEDMLQQFDRDSKTGVGVHVFRFKKDGKIFIGSEVTDQNNVLDVKYHIWEKKGNGQWEPTHVFSSDRAVKQAVTNLLTNGYDMKQKQ